MTFEQAMKAMKRDAKATKRRTLELAQMVEDDRARTPEGRPACANCGTEIRGNRITCSKECLQARMEAKREQAHTVTERIKA